MPKGSNLCSSLTSGASTQGLRLVEMPGQARHLEHYDVVVNVRRHGHSEPISIQKPTDYAASPRRRQLV